MGEPAVEIGGVLRRYAWGSTTLLQDLLGDEPDGRPAAELWFGDHDGDPSPAGDTTLDHLIAAAPEAMLGASAVERFGPHLPFLLKVLAAGSPLSIQVHPSLAQAQAGYAREDAAGIQRDAPNRSYVDANHKPELICALTSFEALCGFRPIGETLDVLAGVPELAFVADLLRGPAGLEAAFRALLEHPEPAMLARAVAARATEDGPLRPAWVASRHFPDDIGVAVTVLLNHLLLEPGEAIYLGAGNVHAYLRGMGVEIMASSDNVLRCGLTPKHLNVPELLAITDFRELVEPRRARAGDRFPVPVPDFLLRVLDGDSVLDDDNVPDDDRAHEVVGPAIVLCVDGTAHVDGVHLGPGRAAFVSAARPVTVRGDGHVFVATPG